MLYKILNNLPQEAKKDGSVKPKTPLPLIPLDLSDGFIHLSTKDQVAGTLNAYFKDQTEVVILHVDAPDNPDTKPEQGKAGNRDRSEIKWEWSGSRKSHFPHIYGDLENQDIAECQVLKRDGDKPWEF